MIYVWLVWVICSAPSTCISHEKLLGKYNEVPWEQQKEATQEVVRQQGFKSFYIVQSNNNISSTSTSDR